MKNIYFIYLLFSFYLGINLVNFTVKAQHNQNEIINHNETSDNHHHETIDITNITDIPSIKIKVYPDSVKGWNLEILTTNFIFDPANLDKNSQPNQGHAHLYINGKKVTRIYGNWFYISELPKGNNELKVTLNMNFHEELVYQGKIISDQIIIENK